MNTTIIIENQKIIFDRYQKASLSERYLNFNSHYPLCHKIGTIYGFVDRIVKLSHPWFHRNNLVKAILITLNNGYPLSFIFSKINIRLKFHIYNKKPVSHDVSQVKDNKKIFTVPYVKSISERFLPITAKFNCKLAYTIPNTLEKFIKRGKDDLDLLHNHDVVYKISCDDRDASYIRQTRRKLGTRLNEHISDINKKADSPFVITGHRVNYDHKFN